MLRIGEFSKVTGVSIHQANQIQVLKRLGFGLNRFRTHGNGGRGSILLHIIVLQAMNKIQSNLLQNYVFLLKGRNRSIIIMKL